MLDAQAPEHWTSTALQGVDADLSTPQSLIGTNLLDAMSPFYKNLFKLVFERINSGKSSVVAWRYCADTEMTWRQCMLWICRLSEGHILFSTMQFDEHIRQPVQGGFPEDESSIVDICGWCMKLKHRDWTKWQSADTFNAAMMQIGVTLPRSLRAKPLTCETCAKELSHTGMAWIPSLPRTITDVHSHLLIVCCSSDVLLLRELTLRISAVRPWQGCIFPVQAEHSPVPSHIPPVRDRAVPSLPLHIARECVRVVVLSNPLCGALATDEPRLAEWFQQVCGRTFALSLFLCLRQCAPNPPPPFLFFNFLPPPPHTHTQHVAVPIIGIASDEATSVALTQAGCAKVVQRPRWKELKKVLTAMV